MTEEIRKYDLAIIGGGPGGYTAAAEAGKKGLSVVLIERDSIGGTCLNRGCIPTKALLHASGLYAAAKKQAAWLGAPEDRQPDFSSVAAYRDETVGTLRDGVEKSLRAARVKIAAGEGKIKRVSPDGIRISVSDGTELDARDVILATGSAAVKIPVPGMDLPQVITSDEMLRLTALPQSVLIIGGGVIGCEFACCLSEFGVGVTVVEALPRILFNMDREISQSLKMIFQKQGIRVLADRTVRLARQGSDGRTEVVAAENKEGARDEVLAADCVLVAAGRKAVTDGFCFPDAFADGKGPVLNRGRILTDENGETSVPHLFAVGDITPGIQLAHSAAAEGKHVVRYLAGKYALPGAAADPCSLSLVPSCIYTSPEIASVGLTEDEAKKAGMAVRCAKAVTGANARSVISGEERGFLKFVAAADTGRLVGAQFMCARASDLIGEAGLAIANGLTAADCLKIMRAHPTYEEAMTDALEKLV